MTYRQSVPFLEAFKLTRRMLTELEEQPTIDHPRRLLATTPMSSGNT